MSEQASGWPTNWRPVESDSQVLKTIAAELGRIADSLERLAPTPEAAECGERRDEDVCGLRVGHVGYHVSADGNLQWLDDQPTQVRGLRR